MVMKAHKKTSGVWLIVETVLVFVLGWFLADPEIMKLYRSMFIPMGWDYENVVVVPVEVLPDYDPDYRPEAMERERMTEDFRRMGEVLSSVSGVEYAAPCRPYFPGLDPFHGVQHAVPGYRIRFHGSVRLRMGAA